jgi:hypothetical protein
MCGGERNILFVLLAILLFSSFYDFDWDTERRCIGRYVPVHKAASTNNGVFSYYNSRHDDTMTPYFGIFFQNDRPIPIVDR